jgi:signal peptidase I
MLPPDFLIPLDYMADKNSNLPEDQPITPSEPDLSKQGVKASAQPAEEPWWLEAVKTILIAIVLALGIRTFVAEARWIPSGSMIPTLKIDDRLIVDKVSYRLHDPRRGDVVVFNPTNALKPRFKEAFIKRVIGIPGDRVELQDGYVVLNGQLIQESYVANNGRTLIQSCYSELDHPFLENPQTVPKDHYLVLGDNRENSFDGRCWGLVGKEDLVGRAVFRFWPVTRLGTLPQAKVSKENIP